MRIVIAEDQEVSRRMLEAILRKWGHDVVACRDGRQALAKLEAPDPPPIGILDWEMPEMDGAEVCRRLRKAATGAQLYLMLLTGKTETPDIVKGLEAGADDYVTKPFHPDELRARLHVGARVVELQRRLIASERDRVLTETAGAAAHEISQPLTVVLGTSQLLLMQEGRLGVEREDLEAIHGAGKRIQAIVEKMGEARSYAARDYLLGTRIADFGTAAEAGGSPPKKEEQLARDDSDRRR